MKTFGTTANISVGSNKVISSTNCHWAKIIPGSFFKFTNDTEWIKVLNSSDFFWIKEFTTKHKNIITLSENVFPILQVGDELELTYKEYELSDIKIISNGGTNYSVDEILYFNGGNVSTDLQQPTAIKVKSINEHGEITNFEIFNRGKYLSFPEGEILTSSSGCGHGAAFFCNYKEIESRGWTDKIISNISYGGSETIISLNSSLPDGLQKGKISVKKWELVLDKQYFNRPKNVVSESYEVHRDFILGSQIPLLRKGHANPDFVINQGFEILWKKIQDLEKQINSLKPNE